MTSSGEWSAAKSVVRYLIVSAIAAAGRDRGLRRHASNEDAAAVADALALGRDLRVSVGRHISS
jgi:hypothetical protein